MKCLKTISVENQFGKLRLSFLSVIIMMSYFLLFFMVFRTFFQNVPLVDHGILFLFFSLIVIMPVHLLLHCFPIWLTGKKATLGVRKRQWPYFYYSTKQPLSKYVTLLSTAAPAFILTLLSIVGAIIFPHLVHYIAMMSAFNMGICVYDYLNFRQIKRAPRQCLIEETRDGFYILSPVMKDNSPI
ncbi:DUF3267 domain-containing protein [Bacillus sp. A301a_S52]|jgi:hypothetical protein|nr:DUF3267 domain-containing protein [Bacillus sp. A301a_S52]